MAVFDLSAETWPADSSIHHWEPQTQSFLSAKCLAFSSCPVLCSLPPTPSKFFSASFAHNWVTILPGRFLLSSQSLPELSISSCSNDITSYSSPEYHTSLPPPPDIGEMSDYELYCWQNAGGGEKPGLSSHKSVCLNPLHLENVEMSPHVLSVLATHPLPQVLGTILLFSDPVTLTVLDSTNGTTHCLSLWLACCCRHDEIVFLVCCRMGQNVLPFDGWTLLYCLNTSSYLFIYPSVYRKDVHVLATVDNVVKDVCV